MLTWSGPVSTPPIIRKLNTGATYHFLISSPPFIVHSAYAFLMNDNYNSSKYLWIKQLVHLPIRFSIFATGRALLKFSELWRNRDIEATVTTFYVLPQQIDRQRDLKKILIASTSLASWSSPTALSNKFEICVHYSQ